MTRMIVSVFAGMLGILGIVAAGQSCRGIDVLMLPMSSSPDQAFIGEKIVDVEIVRVGS